MGKMDKIRHRAVICYLGLKSLTPKQVHQDMETTLGDDTPSKSMANKWAGEFKRDRGSLEGDPVQEDWTMPDFVHFSIFKV